jgi:peptidoglycan/xylan/chitin deacetylase (PgdA/CDA1 family)
MSSLGGLLLRHAGPWIPPELARGFGRPAAVFFHGVEADGGPSKVENPYHDAEAFRRICRSLKQNFDVLPLEALPNALAHPSRHRRSIFLMSDDGYANTLDVGAGILKEFGLPWTLLVSTRHIDTGEHDPTFLARLFFHFAPAGSYVLPHLDFPLVLATLESRDRAEKATFPLLKLLDAARARETIAAMAGILNRAGLGEIIENFPAQRFLTWYDVRVLHRRGVTIGAHAHWHWPLNAQQSQETLREQAAVPKARIEAEIGPCRFFSYPFGNVSDIGRAAWQAVRDAGYDFAFTTLAGSLESGGNPWLLPRYGLGPHDTRLGGLIPLLRAGNGRLRRWQAQVA